MLGSESLVSVKRARYLHAEGLAVQFYAVTILYYTLPKVYIINCEKFALAPMRMVSHISLSHTVSLQCFFIGHC